MKIINKMYPKDTKITGRSSTIRASFIKAIIPVIEATEEKANECLSMLQQNPNYLECSYCGETASELDHFRPIVQGKTPTGYVTDIYNLVPSCGKCNQSKGSKYWKDWIKSNAKLSPTTRLVPDLDQKIAILDKFERWSDQFVAKMPEAFLSGDEFKEYLKSCEDLILTFKNYQEKADNIREALRNYSGPVTSTKNSI